MSYQIIKGWPSDAAIDMTFEIATDELVKDGVGVAIDSDGKAEVADYAEAATDALLIPGFCIGVDNVTGDALCLLSQCVIKVDADHYETGSYTPGAGVSFAGGKFELIASTGDERPQVGTVISYSATTGYLVVFFGKVTEATATTAT